MSENHTPGRLAVTHNNWETSTIYSNGKEVARVHIDSEASDDDEQHRDNARRLVACWNACEGIPTDMLEAMPFGPAALVPMYARLEAQRDELREALEFFLKWGRCQRAEDKARAAIAKTESAS